MPSVRNACTNTRIRPKYGYWPRSKIAVEIFLFCNSAATAVASLLVICVFVSTTFAVRWDFECIPNSVLCAASLIACTCKYLLERKTDKRGRCAVPKSFARTRRWRTWFLVKRWNSCVIEYYLRPMRQQPYLVYGEQFRLRSEYLCPYMVQVIWVIAARQRFDLPAAYRFR